VEWLAGGGSLGTITYDVLSERDFDTL